MANTMHSFLKLLNPLSVGAFLDQAFFRFSLRPLPLCAFAVKAFPSPHPDAQCEISTIPPGRAIPLTV